MVSVWKEVYILGEGVYSGQGVQFVGLKCYQLGDLIFRLVRYFMLRLFNNNNNSENTDSQVLSRHLCESLIANCSCFFVQISAVFVVVFQWVVAPEFVQRIFKRNDIIRIYDMLW